MPSAGLVVALLLAAATACLATRDLQASAQAAIVNGAPPARGHGIGRCADGGPTANDRSRKPPISLLSKRDACLVVRLIPLLAGANAVKGRHRYMASLRSATGAHFCGGGRGTSSSSS